MQSIHYYDLNAEQKNLFFEFLQRTHKNSPNPAYANMWHEQWHEKNNTLPFILEKTDRFKNGLFQVLFDQGNIVGCSGAYTSEFSPEVAILGTRLFVCEEYRNQLVFREELLPRERAWAIKTKHRAVMLTFNEYNKNIMVLWFRTRLGKKLDQRQPYHFGFNGLTKIDFPIKIQFTRQYAMYEKLDPTFSYDWNQIKFED